MTAINSNRAIRGPVTAVPVVAGKGVRLVADTENNRWVVEADETELLDTPQSSSTAPMTLNETVAHFERIKVYGYWNYNGTQRMQACVEFPSSDGAFSLYAFGCRNTTANVSGFYTCSVAYTVSGTSITVVKALREIIPSEENVSYSDSLKVSRVIGINRIASN